MTEPRDCPVCGGPIMIEYIKPDMFFNIENGKLVRDTNHDLWDGTDPYLRFVCTNDSEHDMEAKTIMDDPEDRSLMEWMEKIEEEFYEKIFPDL